jgi:hypothetical protein
MRFLYLILFFVNSIVSIAQSVEVEWERSFGGISYEESYDIIQTPDSNILVVGTGGPFTEEFSDCGENYGYVILKIDLEGNILWSKCYGGSDVSVPRSVINSSDGGYVIAGESNAIDGDVVGGHGNADYWIVKLNSVGELEWQITIGGSSFDSAEDIIQTSDDDYMIVGRSRSTDGDVTDHHATTSTYDILVAKVSSLGELLWTKSYGGTSDDSGTAITQDTSGNFIIAGYSESSSGDVPENKGNADFWVFKIDSAGEIIWSNTYGGSETDNCNDLVYFEDNIYIVGETYSNNFDVSGNHGSRDGWLLKISNEGNFIQQKCFGGTNFEEFFDMKVVDTNAILISGISGSSNWDVTEHFGPSFYSDYWIVLSDTIGNIIWQKSIGGSLGEHAYACLGFFDNSYLVTGYTNSSDFYVSENGGGSDIWTVKLKVCYNKYYVDTDSDGFGDITNDTIACNIPLGYVTDSTDCDDTNPAIHPTLTDICNAVDDNCNGITDEDATFVTYFLDNDGDLFGNVLMDSTSCNALIGYVENNLDCNDENPDINPLVVEICNAIDDNCNSDIDEGLTIYTLYADVDGDAYGNPDALVDTCLELVFGYVTNNLDCNDTLATIYPGATELCNYLDDDCDGLADENLTYILSYQDADSDNFGNPLVDSLACELPDGYIIDNTDCNDANPEIYPGAEELLNGIDDDCDQVADEGLSVIDITEIVCSISPNPSFDIITITSNIVGDGEYTITSSIGQVVLTGSWNVSNNSIDIESIPAGIYTINLMFDDARVSLPFIKLD